MAESYGLKILRTSAIQSDLLLQAMILEECDELKLCLNVIYSL